MKKCSYKFVFVTFVTLLCATKCSYKMKTKPIGVRFDEDDLAMLKARTGIDTAQKAVYYLFSEWKQRVLHGDYVANAMQPNVATPAKVEVVKSPSIKDLPKSDKIAALRDLMNAPVSVVEEKKKVVPVDYHKLHSECVFQDEFRDLWVRINGDPNLSFKEKQMWRVTLNAK